MGPAPAAGGGSAAAAAAAVAAAAGAPLRPISALSAAKPIRLILTDFDGTFTDPHNNVVPANVEGFKLAQQLGIKVGIATGRGRSSAVGAVAAGGGSSCCYSGSPGVFCNGALVFGSEGQELVNATLSADNHKRVLDLLQQRGLLQDCLGLTGDESYCQDLNKNTLLCFTDYHEEKPILIPPDQGGLYSRQFNKLMIWNDRPVLLDLRAHIEQHFSDCLECTMPYPTLLELCCRGVSKGSGVRALAASLGLGLDEVVVLGDSENDISMFGVAGTAVVVQNGAPEAKAAAHYQACPAADGPLLQVVKTLHAKGLTPKP